MEGGDRDETQKGSGLCKGVNHRSGYGPAGKLNYGSIVSIVVGSGRCNVRIRSDPVSFSGVLLLKKIGVIYSLAKSV